VTEKIKRVIRKRSKKSKQRSAIALLITLFFVISVTAAVGVSMIQLRLSAEQVREGKCLIQSSMILDDLRKLLKTSPVLDKIKDADELRYFLENTSIIPVALENLNVKINIHSAMGRININSLASFKAFQEALSVYMLQYDIEDIEYFQDLLIDSMSGNQPHYRTDVFDSKPWLYRERIVSMAHLEQIIDYYIMTRHDENIKKIPWKQLVRFSVHNDRYIDANYMTPQVWQLLLPDLNEGVSTDLAKWDVVYKESGDFGLSEEDLEHLKKFRLSYYVPRLEVNVDVSRNDQNVHVAFEYDLKTKKGGNFDYGL